MRTPVSRARYALVAMGGGVAAMVAGSGAALAQCDIVPPSVGGPGTSTPGLVQCGPYSGPNSAPSDPTITAAPANSSGLVNSAADVAQGMANQALSNIPGFETFVSGRVRTTNHDGYTVRGTNGRSNPFDQQEASVFGSASMAAPGKIFGANVRLTALVGHTWLTTEMLPGALTGQIKKRVGSSDATATMIGGSALFAWSSGWYAVSSTVGFISHTETNDRVNAIRSEYDGGGVVTNLTAGRVMALDNGWKLDLRAAAAYGTYEGDTFRVFNARLSPHLSMWTAAFQPMLFTDIPFNGGTLRPYVQGTIKGIGAYDNNLNIRLDDGTGAKLQFGQNSTYWGSELGMNYGINSWTFGAAVYTDQSKNEQTYGAKLGASYKFGK